MKGMNLGTMTGLRDKNSAESLHFCLTMSHPQRIMPSQGLSILILAPANLATGLMRSFPRKYCTEIPGVMVPEKSGLHLPPALLL